MKILGFSLSKKSLLWVGVAIVVLAVAARFVSNGGAQVGATCPGSQVYCPGVGCLSGKDKCVPGAVGGPSKVFSKETFTGQCKDMKPCPGGTRTDGPCLMEFA